ncbi:MAG: hypothetical protein ACXVJV_17475 [Mucilaginibacter sp.]
MEPISGKRNSVKVKLLLIAVVCVAMVYSSCRKTDNAAGPSTSTKVVSTDTLSGQVALNLSSSLAGHFGGVNLMDGVDSLSLGGHNGPQHGSGNNTLCGFFTDSLVNYNRSYGDTVEHMGGNLTFYFDCKDGRPQGYTAYDSLLSSKSTHKGLNQFYVKQYYTIKCLDDKHLFEGVNGDIYYFNSITSICSCHSSFTEIENVNYVLKDLDVDLCHKDILSGTATFKAYGLNWSLTGTIAFLGNHMADVAINDKIYHVNLLTGKIG